MHFVSYLTDFNYFRLKIVFRTLLDMVRTREKLLFWKVWNGFNYFSLISVQLFYFLSRIIPDKRWWSYTSFIRRPSIPSEGTTIYYLGGNKLLSPNVIDKNRLTWKMQKLKNLIRQFSTKTKGELWRKIIDFPCQKWYNLIFISFKKKYPVSGELMLPFKLNGQFLSEMTRSCICFSHVGLVYDISVISLRSVLLV